MSALHDDYTCMSCIVLCGPPARAAEDRLFRLGWEVQGREWGGGGSEGGQLSEHSDPTRPTQASRPVKLRQTTPRQTALRSAWSTLSTHNTLALGRLCSDASENSKQRSESNMWGCGDAPDPEILGLLWGELHVMRDPMGTSSCFVKNRDDLLTSSCPRSVPVSCCPPISSFEVRLRC